MSRATPIEFIGGITTMPAGTSNLSTDISDDHPISFIYNSALANADGELVDPANLTGPVQLENEQLQCTACHDPHQDIYEDFLVVSTINSDLCLYCHVKNGWDFTPHKTSTATWNGTGNDPWFHTPYNIVAENACENCHNPHNAVGHPRLMNYLVEENNCLECHNGNVAAKDIQAQLNKPHIHDVFSYMQVHDPQEQNTMQTKHVECQDCHNPHFSRNQSASAPDANGFIEGTKGVNTSGNPVEPIQYQYELCYRCHADSPDKPGSTIPRVIEQDNVRLEFDLSNPSYHPIEGPGKNNNVPSLLPPYTEASVIYCTDCHASDGTAPAGPH
ncbi:MAG: cytochrome c3 family protein, partial [Calditrichia bacterium]